MTENTAAAASGILRLLPSIETLLRSGTAQRLVADAGPGHLTVLARAAVDSLRAEILESGDDAGSSDVSGANLLELAEKRLEQLHVAEKRTGLRKVINASGVVIHTNLGRAPLSAAARQAVAETAAGYCSLEYDIASGKRGRRGRRAEELIASLTGAEAALIVNNCAAATVLILTALASGGEAIVSRGELVEIGGDFRVPDVMAQSGAEMKEVGTTNRTKLADYENAINERTKILVKVHPSNYRIVGFTSSPDNRELADLAGRRGVLFYEDAGSGALIDLGPYGLDGEPVIGRSIADGADIVSFSGDKLLGSAQAGFIVGKSEPVGRLRKHPLYRALRPGKLIYAAIEATLESFRRGTQFDEIPVLTMLAAAPGDLAVRTAAFADRLRERRPDNTGLRIAVIEGNSVIGGGSAPTTAPPTNLLALRHETMSVNALEEKLRTGNPPVAARIEEEAVVLDLRTVAGSEESVLLDILAGL